MKSINEHDVEQVITACVDGTCMRLQSLEENDASFILYTTSSYECGGERLKSVIVFNKTDLTEEQQSTIRSIDNLYLEEQNRICLEMFKQPGSHMHEYAGSVTIWNRIPNSKQMVSRSFAKGHLFQSTLSVLGIV